ncbi:MAG: PIN domain-containing protein [Fimbriimonadaceae bacterium]|nr:PIN domain-containing protein [Fimbriimonadaceae bacterium]
MTLADTNVWLALAISGHQHFGAATSWFWKQPTQSVAFCRATQHSLMRLFTTRAVMEGYGSTPLSNRAAWQVFDDLASHPTTTVLPEPPGTVDLWRELSNIETASPKVWMDAYLAAFAIASGCRLASTDRAFERFRGLDFEYLF